MKRTPLRRVSKKRARESKVYSVLRANFLVAIPGCEFADCWQRSRDVHHKHGRGKNYLNVSTWMAVCHEHHRWIHDHPNKAREMGLLATR